MWLSVSESNIIAYTSARAVIHATPQCMLRRYSFEWLDDNHVSKAERLQMLDSLSTFHSIRFAVDVQNMYLPIYQLSYVKHLFTCFGNSSISHTQK